MIIRRTPEEMQKIDDYLNAHYPEKGAVPCAMRLKLSERYVRVRANRLGLKMIKFDSDENKSELINRLYKENRELRTEMIKIMHLYGDRIKEV